MGECMKLLINISVWLLVAAIVARLVWSSKRSAEKELKEMSDVHLGVESAHVHKIHDERGRVVGFVRGPK